MSNKELLKSMLHNVINDRQEQASLDLHSYLTSKMREVSGLATPSDESESNDSNRTTELADN